jgi:hypothetical protein
VNSEERQEAHTIASWVTGVSTARWAVGAILAISVTIVGSAFSIGSSVASLNNAVQTGSARETSLEQRVAGLEADRLATSSTLARLAQQVSDVDQKVDAIYQFVLSRSAPPPKNQ